MSRGMLTLADILTSFKPFGVVHVAMFLAILGVAALTARYRLRLPGEHAQRRFDRSLVWLGLIIVVVNQTAELLPARFQLNRSLPLHLCDVAGLIAPLAILTHHRVLRSMLYYWGIGLSTQAVFTPELQEGPIQFNFWVFWIPHAMIVVLAVYDLVVFRYRPGWKDYFIALATLAVFVAIIFPVNLWLGVNYVYVGRGMPGQTSVIDFLGPWPQRVLILVLGVILLLAMLTLPFVIAKRVQRRQASASDAGGPINPATGPSH